MVRNLKDVLKEVGWADGFNIPVANAENKKLEAEVEALILKKAETIIGCENFNERLESMQSVLRKVVKEKEMNQLLINRLSTNLETERSFMQESEMINNKNEKEIRETNIELSKKEDTKKNLEVQVYNCTVKVTDLRQHLSWGEDSLFAWEEDLAKTDRDVDFIQHYQVMDQNKYNELEQKRQITQMELIEIQAIEKREADKLERMENYFFQLVRDSKQILVERENLMQFWADINQMIKARENKLEILNKKTSDLKEDLRCKVLEYIAADNAYQCAKSTNEYYLKEIEKIEKDREYFETKLESAMKNVEATHHEIEAIEETIKRLENDQNLQKIKNKGLSKSLKAKTLKLKKLQEENNSLKDKIETAGYEQMTAQQKCKTAEDIYEMGQKMLKEEANEINRVEALIKKLSDEMLVLKEKKYLTEREFNEAKGREGDLNERSKSNETKIKDLIEEQYNLELEMIDTGHKLALLEGSKLDIETQNRLKAQMDELQEEVDQNTRENLKLKGEIRNLNKELSFLLADLKQAENERGQLQMKIKESKCAIGGGKKAFIQAQEEYNKLMLELNLVKMQINFTEENKKKESLSVSALERQKLYLDKAMQDRFGEIQVHKEFLLAQRKGLNEEKSFLKRSMDHLSQRIDTSKKRYDIILDSMGKGEDGERISLTLFQVKAAQEKCELQELGDELEARINKTEKEIQAMENTLRVVASTNDNFKYNLESLDAESKEVIEFTELQKKYIEISRENKKLKLVLDEMKAETVDMENEMKQLQQEGKDIQQEWKQKEREVSSLTKDLASKQIKLERATKVLQKLTKDVRAKEATIPKRIALRDIEIRIEAERNKCVLQQLAELASIYIETSPMVNKYLSEKGLSLPTLKDSIYSVRTSTPEMRSSDAGSRMSALSDISLTPSIVHLDPTILLPDPYKRGECKK